ncbi:MAG: NADH-ubiquinone oxidoreductase-F iron-sulfur binding region domain-containing protein [Candidatus Auribacterota bacterium]|nr:NADH-ubiquinone oxidoreductase-F iron-sulfur binding region domain-containing protein [Candidatus Auribacterota bacterium]
MFDDIYKPLDEPCVGKIVICTGTGCVASGSLKVLQAFTEEIRKAGFDVAQTLPEAKESTRPDSTVRLSKSGCQGFCQMGPLVTVLPENILYTKVKPEDVAEIVTETLLNKRVIERLLYKDPVTKEPCQGQHEIVFYKRQSRFVLKMCGELDPESIDEYIERGGYDAAKKAYSDMTPEQICKMILESGLRGRGGGGFPTGRKWELTRIQPGDKKYVICNGDEGDPGAFMDRSVMEGNPHSVIEGIMIAARAVGADEAYIYVRMEYPLAVKRLRKAVEAAESKGVLGKNVLGSGRQLICHVMEGAGAFVCGEETALISSIEGKRGMPSPKPPFPAQKGLNGKPTVINNVETLATIPLIVNLGVEKFRKIGNEKSPGTKTFALSGHVANTGLIEVPLGITLREIIYDIGGGVTDKHGTITNDGFKIVQIGGPSGGCLTEQHLELSLDFDSLREIGAMIGSGGLVLMNKNTCMVSVAHYFMQFTQNESCGKCVLCREGTKQMLYLLEDIMNGQATAQTLELLEQLARVVQKGSLCGLGKTAPNPVLSTLRYFRDEYEAHVFGKRCPAGQCKALLVPEIDPEKCKGCTLCARKCPVEAITGERGKPHTIDPEKCIKCGACVAACKFLAVTGV